MEAAIKLSRYKYHRYLLDNGIFSIDSQGIPSNADKSSRLSVSIAKIIAEKLAVETHTKGIGQTLGAAFEQANLEFLRETFISLGHLRPGKWHIQKLGNRNTIKTSSFYQYSHLEYITELIKKRCKHCRFLR